MNGTMLSVCLPGADAAQLVEAGRLAEEWSVNLWIGDPAGATDNSDDTYITTAAAALAAVTSHARLGVFLTLGGTATPLRAAEDVGVVDQAAGGRLEIGLVAPDDGLSDWEQRARSMLDAWHTWPAGEERTVAATPRPAQPWLSRLVIGGEDTGALADRLRGGAIVRFGEEPLASSPECIARRTVLMVADARLDEGVNGWLSPDPWRRIREVRTEVDRQTAHELLVCLPSAEQLELDFKTLGTVVGPAIRCSSHQAELLTHDAWQWMTERQHLHTSAGQDGLEATAPLEQAHV